MHQLQQFQESWCKWQKQPWPTMSMYSVFPRVNQNHIDTICRYIASPDKKLNKNYLGPASLEDIAKYVSSICAVQLSVENVTHLNDKFFMNMKLHLQMYFEPQAHKLRPNTTIVTDRTAEEKGLYSP